MYIGSEERAQGHPDVSNSYPWRPLHSMPLDRPVVVDSVDHGMVVAFPSDAGLWFYWAGRRPHSLQGDVPALSIAWKFVLDRAVQRLAGSTPTPRRKRAMLSSVSGL